MAMVTRPEHPGVRGLIRDTLVAAALALVLPCAAGAAGVQTELRVGLDLTFAENESPTLNETGVVTTLSPGISLSKTQGRVLFDLDYQLNAIYYHDISEADREDHSLSLTSRVIHDAGWYTQFTSGISRYNIDVDGLQSTTPLLNADNSGELHNLGVNTFYNREVARNLFLAADAGVDRADTDGSPPSDGAGLGVRLSRESAPGAFDWAVAARGRENSANNVSERIDTYDAVLGYGFSKSLRGLAELSRSEISTTGFESDSSMLGFEFRPNRRFMLRLTAGERDDTESYSLDMRHTRRHVEFSANYNEDIITPRDQTLANLGQQEVFQTSFQELSITPVLQKRAQLGLSVQGKRSLFSATLFHAERTQAGVPSTASRQKGLRLSLTRQLGQQSSMGLSLGTQETRQVENNRLDDFEASYARQLARQLDFNARLGLNRQSSSNAQNQYEQRILSFSLKKTF